MANKKGSTPWNKGLTKETSDIIKQHSERMKEIHKTKNFNYGHICSDETKNKISESMKRWFSDPKNKEKHLEASKNNPNKKHTEETKRKLSELRKKWLSEHKDQHPWKNKDRFKSHPCENLKEYLKSKEICFVEEYQPFDDYNYCLDIAWPDEKIAIEVNGNQHYNSDGSLKEYYQKRHELFESRGWKLFELHYSKCYNIKLEDLDDILNLPIYDKEYVGKYISKREQKDKDKKEHQKKLNDEKIKDHNIKTNIVNDLINNSGIDFSKFGWVKQAEEYLLNKDSLFDKIIHRMIKKYRPDFFKREDVYIRKKSII